MSSEEIKKKPETKKLIQQTLLSCIQNIPSVNKTTSIPIMRDTLFIDKVSPKLLELPSFISTTNYSEIIEIIEFSRFLRNIFISELKINYHGFIDKLLHQLNIRQLNDSCYEIYIICRIYIISFIKLQNFNKKSKTQNRYNYIKKWQNIINFLSYETLPIFIKYFINFWIYTSNDAIRSKEFFSLSYYPDFYNLSVSHKILVLRTLYMEMIDSRGCNRLINEIINFPYNSVILKDHDKASTFNQMTNKSNCNSVNVRISPIKLENSYFLWFYPSIDIVLMEDYQNHKFYYYDDSHLTELRNICNNNKDSRVLIEIIQFIENKQIPRIKSVNDNFDLIESAKVKICELVEKSIKRKTTYKFMENLVLTINDQHPFGLKQWKKFLYFFVNLFSGVSKTWKTRNTDSFRSTLGSPKTYIDKLRSWSEICLIVDVITMRFTDLPEYAEFCRQYLPNKADFEENQQLLAEEENDEVLCSSCLLPITTAIIYDANLKPICRACRLNNRNSFKEEQIRKRKLLKGLNKSANFTHDTKKIKHVSSSSVSSSAVKNNPTRTRNSSRFIFSDSE